jgi:hypothetical protein
MPMKELCPLRLHSDTQREKMKRMSLIAKNYIIDLTFVFLSFACSTCSHIFSRPPQVVFWYSERFYQFRWFLLPAYFLSNTSGCILILGAVLTVSLVSLAHPFSVDRLRLYSDTESAVNSFADSSCPPIFCRPPQAVFRYWERWQEEEWVLITSNSHDAIRGLGQTSRSLGAHKPEGDEWRRHGHQTRLLRLKSGARNGGEVQSGFACESLCPFLASAICMLRDWMAQIITIHSICPRNCEKSNFEYERYLWPSSFEKSSFV